ncbi:MAG: CoA-binding protein [Halobacteria archaeon]|nr:CoA-binding protein [Halobacteria archaeon]
MPVKSDDELREILGMKRVAVIGCSRNRRKDAHQIPKYLLDQGYDVIPVNPFADEIFGLKAYDSVSEVKGDIDIVNVFRPSDEVSGIVDRVIERGNVKVIWTQLGIQDDEAAERAEEAGVKVVQDKCMKIEHQRLM